MNIAEKAALEKAKQNKDWRLYPGDVDGGTIRRLIRKGFATRIPGWKLQLSGQLIVTDKGREALDS